MYKNILSTVILAGLMVGCGGAGDKEKFDGDRISVLSFEASLRVDPRLRDTPVPIVPPFRNAGWNNPGGFSSHAAYHLELDGLGEAFTTQMVSGNKRLAHIKAPPVVAEGKVFAMGAMLDVVASDAKSGAKLWQTSVLAQRSEPNFSLTRLFGVKEKPAQVRDGFGGGLAYANGRVYVTTGFGEIMALDAASGDVIWRVQNNIAFSNAPTVRNGRIYVASQDSRLQAFNAQDGTRLWEHLAIDEPATVMGATSVAVNEQIVVAGFSSGEIVALSPVNGQEAWSESLTSRATQVTPLSQLNAIVGRPVIDRDRIYVTSHGGRTVAMDVRSGERIWTADIGSIETPWAMGDFVLLMALDGKLVSLSREQGRVRWIAELPAFENEAARKGRIRWAGPILAGGQVLLASSDGRLASVNPQNGEIGDIIDIDEPVSVTPVVADGMLYMLGDTGTLLARR
jgi:outer membrane protein assembly factor BamB